MACALTPVDFPAMGDPCNDDQALAIVDCVDNPIVAHANPIVVGAREFHNP